MKVYIQPSSAPDFSTVRIFVREENNGEIFNIIMLTDATLSQEKVERFSACKVTPFLELPVVFFDEIAKAVKDYAVENNIQSESETYQKGKLQATEKHLEDMMVNFNKLLDKIISI